MVIAGIRTIAAYVFCSVYTLTVGPVALVLAIVFRKPERLSIWWRLSRWRARW